MKRIYKIKPVKNRFVVYVRLTEPSWNYRTDRPKNLTRTFREESFATLDEALKYIGRQ